MTVQNLPANLTAGGTFLLALLQLGGSSPDLSGVVGPIERLGLVTALIIAVSVLWKANASERREHMRIIEAKDSIIVSMTTKLTETMVSVIDAVKESRRATEEVGAALDNVAENVAALQQTKGD